MKWMELETAKSGSMIAGVGLRERSGVSFQIEPLVVSPLWAVGCRLVR
jgi:hypothetical protein